MPRRLTRSQTKAANADGTVSSGVSAEPEAEPRPAKRAKTKEANKPTVKHSRKKGRLSVLPTLPLDVLFEVVIPLTSYVQHGAHTSLDLRTSWSSGLAPSLTHNQGIS